MSPDKYLKNYLQGSLSPSSNGKYLDNINPATGKVCAYIPDSSEDDIQLAVETAERAFSIWSGFDIGKRYRLLMRLADILEQERELFARIESTDCGKPYSMSISVDIPKAYEVFRFYATSILHYSSTAYFKEQHSVHYHIRKPLGIVACFSHWSFPLLSLCNKVAPALAAGNCVIAHASQWAPMTAHLFSKACIDAGLPPGVLNIIHGKDTKIEEVIFKHPKISAVAYSGDLERAKQLLQLQENPFRKLSLDLGGKNASIVFADCNFHKMIIEVLRSSFSNNGQHAFSSARVYIERTIFDKFKEELVKRTQFLKIGDPFSRVTDLGAIISRQHLERNLSYLALAEVEGGKILCGGRTIDLSGELEEGLFLRPAVLEGLPIHSRTNQEQIFGPIVTIAPFDSDAEAIAMANSTDYGRSATIWTQNSRRANQVAEKLKAGIIWINAWMLADTRVSFTPLGTAGMGASGGMEALHFFTDDKLVGLSL